MNSRGHGDLGGFERATTARGNRASDFPARAADTRGTPCDSKGRNREMVANHHGSEHQTRGEDFVLLAVFLGHFVGGLGRGGSTNEAKDPPAPGAKAIKAGITIEYRIPDGDRVALRDREEQRCITSETVLTLRSATVKVE